MNSPRKISERSSPEENDPKHGEPSIHDRHLPFDLRTQKRYSEKNLKIHEEQRSHAIAVATSRQVGAVDEKPYKDFLLEQMNELLEAGISKPYGEKILTISIRRCYRKDVPDHLRTAGRKYKPAQSRLEREIRVAVRELKEWQTFTQEASQSPQTFLESLIAQDKAAEEHLRNLDSFDTFRNNPDHVPNTESWAKRKAARESGKEKAPDLSEA